MEINKPSTAKLDVHLIALDTTTTKQMSLAKSKKTFNNKNN